MLYAPHSPCRRRQQLRDVLVLVWVALCVAAGLAVYDSVASLIDPANRTSEAAGTFEDGLSDVATGLQDIPLIGQGVAEQLQQAATAGAEVSVAAGDVAQSTQRMALWLALAVGLLPGLGVLALHVVRRVRWRRAALAARAAVRTPGGAELLALRCLTHRAPDVVMEHCPDAADGWRRGNRATVDALVQLELQLLGLEAPNSAGASTI